MNSSVRLYSLPHVAHNLFCHGFPRELNTLVPLTASVLGWFCSALVVMRWWMEPGDVDLMEWRQQCLAAQKGSCETWSTDSWSLRPCSCNFGCHHAWVSLLSRKSGFVLRCKPKQLKAHHQSWTGRVKLEAATHWVTTIKLIRKYHPLSFTKKY